MENIVRICSSDDPDSVPKIEKALSEWDARHALYKVACSEGHQGVQRRMVAFGAPTADQRVTMFDKSAKEFNWCRSTVATYYAVLLGVLPIMNVPTTHLDRAYHKAAERRARRAKPNVPHGITPQEMLDLTQQLSAQCGLAAATSYAMAQRFADWVRVEAQYVTKTIEGFVTVMIVEGKCTARTGPFCVHIPDGPLAEALFDRAKKIKHGPLFDKEAMTTELRSKLQVHGWMQTGMRRGSVQAMVSQGGTFQTCRHLTQHATERMFRQYTEHGRFELGTAMATAPLLPGGILRWQPGKT